MVRTDRPTLNGDASPGAPLRELYAVSNNRRGEGQHLLVRDSGSPTEASPLPTTVVGLLCYIVDDSERTKRACSVLGCVAVILLIALALLVYSPLVAGIVSLLLGTPIGAYRFWAWRRNRKAETAPQTRRTEPTGGQSARSGNRSVTSRGAKGVDRRSPPDQNSGNPRKSRPAQRSARQRSRGRSRPQRGDDAAEPSGEGERLADVLGDNRPNPRLDGP